MKKWIFLFLMTFAVMSCEEDDDLDCAGIDCLPPATQVAANTAGCLVNGEPIIPRGGNRIFQCYYQKVEGEFYFSISFRDKIIGKGCSVVSRMKKIEEGAVYKLSMAFTDTIGYGGRYSYSSNSNQGIQIYSTTKVYTGRLEMTRFDTIRGIASGLFSFDAIDQEGNIVEIREGRFDAKYGL